MEKYTLELKNYYNLNVEKRICLSKQLNLMLTFVRK